MASPLPSTPPPKPFATGFSDRRGIKTPHPKVFLESPSRLTPQKLNVQHILTPPAASSLRATSPTCDEEPEVTNLEITTVEKANEVFEIAVRYLDDAYLIPSKPRYQFVLRAQDLLYKALIYGKNELRLRAFCKLEMVRISPDLDFQRYWIEKGLEDLDSYSPAACYRIKNNLTVPDEHVQAVKDCRATYYNIWKKYSEDFQDLAKWAFQKYEECNNCLSSFDKITEAQPAAKKFTPVMTPGTPNTDNESEAETLEITSVEKGDAVFKTAVHYLKEAYSDRSNPKSDLILLAQDLLYKTLSYTDDGWRLPIKSMIEMTLISSHPDFKQYWNEKAKKALKNLDNAFETALSNLATEDTVSLYEELKHYGDAYLDISRTFLDDFPELTERVFPKYEKYKAFLKKQAATVADQPPTPVASPAKAPPRGEAEGTPQQPDAELVVQPPTPATSDKISTTNKTRAVFFFSCVCLLGLAVAQRGKLKQLVGKISKIAMIYIQHPERLKDLMIRIAIENRLLGNSTSGQH